MNVPSPISAGFRVVFRRPSLALAEVVWRWSFAAAAWFLLAMFLIAYARNLPVSTLDNVLWHSGQPALIGQALHRILAGSGLRFTATAILLALGLTIGWIVLASLGRTAIVRVGANELGISANFRGAIGSLLFLNFLRAAAALAAVAAVVGLVLMTSSFWASTHAAPAQAGRLVVLLWFLSWICWAALNWLLSFVSVFAVIDREVGAAFGTATRLLVRKTGTVFSIGIVFGICHVAAFVAACGAGLIELGLLATVSTPVVVALEILTAIVYCAVADFLYAGRAVAYLALLRPEEPLASAQAPNSLLSPESGSIDKGELILSDLPALVF